MGARDAEYECWWLETRAGGLVKSWVWAGEHGRGAQADSGDDAISTVTSERGERRLISASEPPAQRQPPPKTRPLETKPATGSATSGRGGKKWQDGAAATNTKDEGKAVAAAKSYLQ